MGGTSRTRGNPLIPICDDLQDVWKKFSHHPDEHIVPWLLQCWDNGSSSLELEGKEVKQLGSLSR